MTDTDIGEKDTRDMRENGFRFVCVYDEVFLRLNYFRIFPFLSSRLLLLKYLLTFFFSLYMRKTSSFLVEEKKSVLSYVFLGINDSCC